MDFRMSNAMELTSMQSALCLITMDPVTFATRVREARLAAGLTQQQLADACGISDRTVSAWEKGVAEGILAENLFAVADALRVDPRWLATGARSSMGSIDELMPDQQEAVRALIRLLKR